MSLLLVLLLALLLPEAAQAGFPPDNESDWNKTVKWRITTATTLYSLSYADGKQTWGPDEDPADDAIFTPIGTLPAGKYVNVISSEMAGKREVFYWNGGRRSAWIDEDAYTRDTVSITSTSGQKTSIPSKAYGDAAAVRYILSEFLSADEVEAYIDGMRGGSSDDSRGSSASGGKTASAPKRTVEALPVITLTETAEDGAKTSAEVMMVLPGLLYSTVRKDDAEIAVPTAQLSWEWTGEHALAVIYAPRTGLATLWQTDRGTGALCKLKAGSVVLVLGESGRYMKVLGEGRVGYVLAAALTLCDPAEEAIGMRVREKTALRLEPSARGRRLIWLAEDEEVMVLRAADGWALVEYGGLAGYVTDTALVEETARGEE